MTSQISEYLDRLFVVETIDCGSDEADDAYGHEFLSELGALFNFDGLNKEYAGELRNNARLYFVERDFPSDNEEKAATRKRYKRLKKAALDFRDLISDPDYSDLHVDMYYAGLRWRESPPKNDFPELTDFEKTRGKPYFLELKRLLHLIDNAADAMIENSSPPKGRKKNIALENFVRRTAFIWADLLKKPFTYNDKKEDHKTQAFFFALNLIRRIDPSVTEENISTAMRAVIKERRGLGL